VEIKMPDNMYVVIKLNKFGSFQEILGVFADLDDAQKFANENGGFVCLPAPYNP
jgi:hypothetical protein